MLYADKTGLEIGRFTYEDLADPKWKGKVCIRAGQHPYNTALIAAMIAHDGEAKPSSWLRGVKANLATQATGGDRDVARDILGGICDVGLANSYYVGQMKSAKAGTDARQVGRRDQGHPADLRRAKAAARTSTSAARRSPKNAPHRANAVKLLEFLVSPSRRRRSTREANYEYPVRRRRGARFRSSAPASAKLKVDPLPLTEIAKYRKQASAAGGQGRLRPLTRLRRSAPIWRPRRSRIALGVLAPVASLAWARRWARRFGALGAPGGVRAAAGRAQHRGCCCRAWASLVLVIGTGCAWLVTACDFPGRRVLHWALLLPLAMPTYIVAFAYLDLLHPIGPVQGAIRWMLGFDSPRAVPAARPALDAGRDLRARLRALPLRLPDARARCS